VLEFVLFQPTWLPCSRLALPAEPFTSTDGFDLYIDGCRHLPDVVTISMVFVNSALSVTLLNTVNKSTVHAKHGHDINDEIVKYLHEAVFVKLQAIVVL